MPLSFPDATIALAALVPGFILIYVFIWQANLPDSQTDDQRELFSFVGSVVLASASYLLYVIALSIVERRIILRPGVQFSTGDYLLFITILTFVAIPLGYVAGTIYDREVHQRRGIIRTRRRTWDYINQEAVNPIVASVKTDSGETIQGDIQYAGERQQNDLLLRNPLLKNEDGEVLRRLGRYTYIPQSQIARIDLQTELKNRQKIETGPEAEPTQAESELIRKGELVESNGESFIKVSLENPTETDYYVDVFLEFLNSEGAILEERIEIIPELKHGEKTVFLTPYNGELAGEISDYDISVSPVSLPE